MENVAVKKGIKYWVRELRHLSIIIAWSLNSDYFNFSIRGLLPESLQLYSISFAMAAFFIAMFTLIFFDIPFFQKIKLEPKFIVFGFGFTLIAVFICSLIIYFINIIPELNVSFISAIYVFVASIILLGLVLGFMKRSEEMQH
jgi:4-amino-4-deoxy-L-arabinose transferase-like glycosyltransferase